MLKAAEEFSSIPSDESSDTARRVWDLALDRLDTPVGDFGLSKLFLMVSHTVDRDDEANPFTVVPPVNAIALGSTAHPAIIQTSHRLKKRTPTDCRQFADLITIVSLA